MALPVISLGFKPSKISGYVAKYRVPYFPVSFSSVVVAVIFLEVG